MSTSANPIVNKVKQSKLVTIDLEKWIRLEDCMTVDLKDFLFMGLIVKEKEFREALDAIDLTVYEGKIVRLYCSADAIIPKWAWMLAYLKLSERAEAVHIGTDSELITNELLRKIRLYPWDHHQNGFLILKGCSKLDIPDSVYAEAASYASKHAKKVMFGEACSNVPIFKTS